MTGVAVMKCGFDFIGLNTVVSGAYKPLVKVTPSVSRKAGMDAGINGTNPKNCHYSYFTEDELETEWYRGYRLGRQNRQE